MTYLTYKKGTLPVKKVPFRFYKLGYFVALAFLYHLGKLGQIALATICIIYILKAFDIL